METPKKRDPRTPIINERIELCERKVEVIRHHSNECAKMLNLLAIAFALMLVWMMVLTVLVAWHLLGAR